MDSEWYGWTDDEKGGVFFKSLSFFAVRGVLRARYCGLIAFYASVLGATCSGTPSAHTSHIAKREPYLLDNSPCARCRGVFLCWSRGTAASRMHSAG